MISSADKRIAAGLFLLAAVTFGWSYGGAGWNQDAHFDLTRALVERRTLYVDGYDVNTGDVSHYRGHTYINKAPGLSFVAALPYALIFAAERAVGVSVNDAAHTNIWLVTWIVCGLSGAGLAAALYLHGRRRVGARAVDSVAAALAVAFGTIVFAYSTMLFAHVPAALALTAAVILLRRRPALAGVMAGISASFFYVSALAAVILAIASIMASRRDGLRFAAGAAPFAAAIGLYHWFCFGSPFRTAVETSEKFTEKGLLFGVLRLPRIDALYGITFSPYRGLFFASPVLVLALFGLVPMWRKGERREAAVIASITGAYLGVIASFNGWNGGWAFGPRYLLPIVPLLGIALLHFLRHARPALRVLFGLAAVVSIAINFVATATDAMPSPDVKNPVIRYLVPAFARGRIPEETRVAFPWYGSTKVEKVALPREAANLGEKIFGNGKRASIMPVGLMMIAGSAALAVAARKIDAPG